MLASSAINSTLVFDSLLMSIKLRNDGIVLTINPRGSKTGKHPGTEGYKNIDESLTSGKASLNRSCVTFQLWLRAAKARLWDSDEVMEPVVISSESMNESRPVRLFQGGVSLWFNGIKNGVKWNRATVYYSQKWKDGGKGNDSKGKDHLTLWLHSTQDSTT